MRVPLLPKDSFTADTLRSLWPEREPSVELQTRTMYTALQAIRRGYWSRAIPHARRLAVMVYISSLALVLSVLIALSDAQRYPALERYRNPFFVFLMGCGLGAAVLAVCFASRWGSAMGLSRNIRWIPLASLLGVLVITTGIINAVQNETPISQSGTPGSAVLPASVQTSLDLVPRALTYTMSISASQAWLDARLPQGVERAWFVTPEGLIALSSITKANEINRNVVDFIALTQAITQTAQAHIATFSEGFTQTFTGRDMTTLVSLRNLSTLTRAISYSSTPVVLLIMVKQALLDVSSFPQHTLVSASFVHHEDGSLAGISAVAWKTPVSTLASSAIILVILGYLMVCAGWATWVYLSASARVRAKQSRGERPLHWALLTAFALPVGLLAYLYSHSDENSMQ